MQHLLFLIDTTVPEALCMGGLHARVAKHDLQQRLARIQASFPEGTYTRIPPSASLFERQDDPRPILTREFTKLSRRQAILKSFGRAVDLFGALTDPDHWHRILQTARVEPKVSPAPRVDVGDCLRGATSEVASEFPLSFGDEDTRVV